MDLPHSSDPFFCMPPWANGDGSDGRQGMAGEFSEHLLPLLTFDIYPQQQQQQQDVRRDALHRLSPEPSNHHHHHHHHHHAHNLLLSSGASGTGKIMAPMPQYRPGNPMMLPSFNSAGGPPKIQMSKKYPPQPQSSSSFVAFQDGMNSTDATPESSDVEEEGRALRRKRSKKVLSEDQSLRHSEHAKAFPSFMEGLRQQLLRENADGVVQEAAAVDALIVEFARSARQSRYILPQNCEQWMKQAADDVHEIRAANKGARKKKESGAMSAAAVAAVTSPGGDRNFACQQCFSQNEIKLFKTQEGLNLHVRNKHSKDKPWVCRAPNCCKAFVRQADLRMHMIRMHSSDRPFPCGIPFCTKAFAGESELRRHVKVDHYKHIRELCGNQPITRVDL